MIYGIAGLKVSFKARFSYTAEHCADYLLEGGEDASSPLPDVVAKTTEKEMADERACACSENFSDGYIENICLCRDLCRRLPLFGRMLLHGAAVTAEGDGYAFLGRSGAGKSTHIRLWKKFFPDVDIVNGDKPVLDFSTDDCVRVCGSPWTGKEGWGKNVSAPLRGMCFIEQSRENSIGRLTARQSAVRIFRQVFLPEEKEAAERTLFYVDRLVKSIPAWVLRCDVSESAARLSYGTMTGKDAGQG